MPAYLMALGDTAKITGDFSSFAAPPIALAISISLMLNAPTAYLPALAFSRASFKVVNIMLLAPSLMLIPYIYTPVSYLSFIQQADAIPPVSALFQRALMCLSPDKKICPMD